MRRVLAATLAMASVVAANVGGGGGIVVASPNAAPMRASAPGYVTVPLRNVSADQVGRMVHTIYPGIRYVVDRANNLVMQGTATDLASAKRLAAAIDRSELTTADSHSIALRSFNQDVRVFTIKDPTLGPQVAAAVSAFIQGLPPLPAPSSSPAQSTVNVVVKTGSGMQPAAAATLPPSVVLAPSQAQIIVRADTRTLDIIERKVLPALAVAPPAKSPQQQFQSYEVQNPVPNPLPSGGALLATSSINDLATAVQNIINQTSAQDVRVNADPSYPRIIVAGSPSGVANALGLLHALDKRPAQVNIQAWFYEIDTNAASNIGFQLPTGSIQATIGEYSPPSGFTAGGSPIPATPAPLLLPQKLTHTNISLATQLNLLYQRGNAKLVAAPHVATINGRRTILSVTNTIPFPVTNPGNSASVPTVQNYQTGTTLDIVPMVNGDGSITAFLHPVYSTLTGFTAQAAPLVSMREAFTTFRLSSGEAAFISGLEEINESDTFQKVPIPLIGSLLRNRVRQRVTTQLFIVLKATIIDPGDLEIAPLELNGERTPTPKPRPIEEPLPTPPFIATLPPAPSSPPTPTPTPTPRAAPRGQ
jgi:hypothetical protein